jgi:[ribosomal protein S5]-alanine N-acetyltransferase
MVISLRGRTYPEMSKLKTERLSLIALNRHQLQAYLDDPAVLEKELGHPISRHIVTDRVRRAIGMKLAKMEAVEETRRDWLTYWLMVTADPPFGAGLVGFKGFPDGCGESEIGYGIDPDWQGRGLMTEAVRAMITWAFREPACRSVVALGVDKGNIASQKVLAKAGMTVYEETGETLNLRIFRAGPASE